MTVAVPDALTADPACAAAVELARSVALQAAEGGAVGEHLGVEAETGGDGDHVVTHSFASTSAGYVGWRWAVTVARAQGSDQVTVDEVVLLPGVGALLAPAWLPWSERIQPGDLSPGDLLPTSPDDPRLVPGYADDEQGDLLWELDRELGLGREKVLSVEGRAETAERWYDGTHGPDAPLARSAPAPCTSCGFFVSLAGSLSQVFGVCGNAFAPDDGRVVSRDHGCGAHSSVTVEPAHAATGSLAVEHEELELLPTEGLPAEDPVVDVEALDDDDVDPVVDDSIDDAVDEPAL